MEWLLFSHHVTTNYRKLFGRGCNGKDSTLFVSYSFEELIKFGLFAQVRAEVFLSFLKKLNKPVVIVFHTVLPHPDDSLKARVWDIVAASKAVIVMTKNSEQVRQFRGN